jgi:hypothetical protein
MKLNEQLLLTEYYEVATCMQEDKKLTWNYEIDNA